MQRIMIFLCNKTLNMPRPWLRAGYECWLVDLQHPLGERRQGNLVLVGADILTWRPPPGQIAGVFAFPPCTDLAVSGARHFKRKGLRSLIQALMLVERCREICEDSGALWSLENPRSTISTYWRKPDYEFDPCDYAMYADEPSLEAYTKRTCLWTGGGFIMPEPDPVVPILGSMMHRMAPGPDRANKRSVTPSGFAEAVYLANYQERNCK